MFEKLFKIQVVAYEKYLTLLQGRFTLSRLAVESAIDRNGHTYDPIQKLQQAASNPIEPQ